MSIAWGRVITATGVVAIGVGTFLLARAAMIEPPAVQEALAETEVDSPTLESAASDSTYPDRKRQVDVQFNSALVQGGVLLPGHRVDVVLKRGGDGPILWRVQDVLVLGIDGIGCSLHGEGDPPQTLTASLVVSAAEAVRLARTANPDDIQLIVRPAPRSVREEPAN